MTLKPGDKVRVNGSCVLSGAIGQEGVVMEPEPKDADMPGHVPVKLENGEWYFRPFELEVIKG